MIIKSKRVFISTDNKIYIEIIFTGDYDENVLNSVIEECGYHRGYKIECFMSPYETLYGNYYGKIVVSV